MIDKTKREIGLCATHTSSPVRIVGPFDTIEEVSEAIRLAPKVKNLKWYSAYFGEMPRKGEVIVEAPVSKTITVKVVPE